MNNEAQWQPSKYVLRGGRWRASHDRRQLGVGSRVVADAVVACYETHLPRYAQGRLVDLGCGRAPLYALYRPCVAQVTCVDWAHSLHDNPYLDRLVDLNATLPFADGSFDTVILSDVLEHVADPQLLWHEMARILAPGGHVLLNLPFLYRIHEAPHDYARYTGFALKRFAAACSLDVLELEPVGGSLAVMADLLGKHLEQGGAVGRMLAAGVARLATHGLRTGWGRRVEQSSSAAFPLGYFMVAGKPAAAGC